MPTDFNLNSGIPQQPTPVGAHPQIVSAAPIDNKEPAQTPEQTASQQNAASAADSLNNQAAVAGQSQIKADNIKGDVASFKGNPQLVGMADQLFDHAYAQLQAQNDPNAYEKACLISSQFVNECVKK